MYIEVFIKGNIPYNELGENKELNTVIHGLMSSDDICEVHISNHRYTNFNTTMVALNITFNEDIDNVDDEWLGL